MVLYNNANNCFIVRDSRKKHIASYSIGSYGKYAEELANLSDISGERYNNYFKVNDDIVTMILYCKAVDDYFSVIFNKSKLALVRDKRWSISINNSNKYKSRYIMIRCSLDNTSLNRFIIGIQNKEKVMYKDGNMLNCLDSNLTLYSDENLIWENVRLDEKYTRFRVRYSVNLNNRRKQITRDIFYNKDNFDEKKNEAIVISIKERKENGYELSNEDLEYIKRYDLKLI